MSLGDFIFGVVAGPVAPLVEWAAGDSKDHINASMMGMVTGGTIAATTAGTILSFGAAAPAAEAADAAVIGADTAEGVGELGAEAGVTAAEAAPDVISGASTIVPETTTEAAAEGASQVAPMTAVDAGTSAPTVEAPMGETMLNETTGNGETLIDETTGNGAKLGMSAKDIGKTVLKGGLATNNVMSGVRQSGNQQAEQVMPKDLGIGKSAGEVAMKPLGSFEAGLVNPPSVYGTVFGGMPEMSSISPMEVAPTMGIPEYVPPAIQPPPMMQPQPQPPVMSDRTQKTNIQNAERSLRDFLSQVRIVNARIA